MLLGKWPGSLGQGLSVYGPVQLSVTVVLEDTSSAYSGSRGSEEGKPYKLKQGVRPNNCQDSKFLLGLIAEGADFMVPGLEGGREPIPAILI